MILYIYIYYTNSIYLFNYLSLSFYFFFFFNDTATTEIYTLSLHDALPIFFFGRLDAEKGWVKQLHLGALRNANSRRLAEQRSEEHTSELQSRLHLVCRLLLEKKKNQTTYHHRRSTTCISTA